MNNHFGMAYQMAHKDESENLETETARSLARAEDSFEPQALVFTSLYGEHAYYAALMDQARRFRLTEEQQKAGLEIELTAEEKEALEEYKTFIDVLMHHPDLRPKLLSKMCYTSFEEGVTSEGSYKVGLTFWGKVNAYDYDSETGERFLARVDEHNMVIIHLRQAPSRRKGYSFPVFRHPEGTVGRP